MLLISSFLVNLDFCVLKEKKSTRFFSLFSNHVTSNSCLFSPNRLPDQWHSDREPLLDRCQEADRKVKGQAKNGGSAGRQGDPAEHPWPRWQHSLSQRLRQRRWGCVCSWACVRMYYFWSQSAATEQRLSFDQTFQISILWRPIIPIDRMTDIVAAGPALQTDGRSPRTTPDTRPHRSATAGKDSPSTYVVETMQLEPHVKLFSFSTHFGFSSTDC